MRWPGHHPFNFISSILCGWFLGASFPVMDNLISFDGERLAAAGIEVQTRIQFEIAAFRCTVASVKISPCPMEICKT